MALLAYAIKTMTQSVLRSHVQFCYSPHFVTVFLLLLLKLRKGADPLLEPVLCSSPVSLIRLPLQQITRSLFW